MINYRIWECKDADYILVEVWNKCDIPSIQKMFIERGYVVLRTEFSICGNYFIKLKSLNLEGIENEQ